MNLRNHKVSTFTAIISFQNISKLFKTRAPELSEGQILPTATELPITMVLLKHKVFPPQIWAQLTQGFQALIHAAEVSISSLNSAHVVAASNVRYTLHCRGSDAKSVGTLMDRLVFVQISAQLTEGLPARTDPACRANLVSIEELQLTS